MQNNYVQIIHCVAVHTSAPLDQQDDCFNKRLKSLVLLPLICLLLGFLFFFIVMQKILEDLESLSPIMLFLNDKSPNVFLFTSLNKTQQLCNANLCIRPQRRKNSFAEQQQSSSSLELNNSACLCLSLLIIHARTSLFCTETFFYQIKFLLIVGDNNNLAGGVTVRQWSERTVSQPPQSKKE